MTDSLELIKYMNQAKITLDELANLLNIDKALLISKISEVNEFYSDEIQTICTILNIPLEKRKAILFD